MMSSMAHGTERTFYPTSLPTIQANASMECNAWIFCGTPGGCHNSDLNFDADVNTCSLYRASALDYNTPLDKGVGVMRGANVTITSGKPAEITAASCGAVCQCRAAAPAPSHALCNAPAAISEGHKSGGHPNVR